MKKLFALFLSLSATTGLACTPGAGNGPSGDPNCMGAILNNDPYYNNKSYGNSPQKIIRHTTVHLPSKYGAIAMNKQVAEIGSSENMDSESAARKAAIQSCKNGNPNVSCKIVATYENGCIAAVGGKKKNLVLFKAVHETSGGYALKKAMAKCEKFGASNCQVLISESCSLP